MREIISANPLGVVYGPIRKVECRREIPEIKSRGNVLIEKNSLNSRADRIVLEVLHKSIRMCVQEHVLSLIFVRNEGRVFIKHGIVNLTALKFLEQTRCTMRPTFINGKSPSICGTEHV